MKKITLLTKNARQLLTLSFDKKAPRKGKEMGDVGLIEDGAVAVRKSGVLRT